MVMKKKTFFRIVTALCTAAVILGAIDVQLIRRLRERDEATALQASRPSSAALPSAEEDDQDAEEGGPCHSAPEAAGPPKELPRLNARMD